ncbi:hypothetical protein COF61_09230 [Bacillus toyonensis]|nr:hypothetical protein COF61_09230 [Bacillus toyonensis]
MATVIAIVIFARRCYVHISAIEGVISSREGMGVCHIEFERRRGYFPHLIVVLLGKGRVAPTYTPIRCEKFRYEMDKRRPIYGDKQGLALIFLWNDDKP